MSAITNKLFADYNSNHIIMVHPSMYNDKNYYNDLVKIYTQLNHIFMQNNIKQTIVLDNKTNYSDFYYGDNSVSNIEIIRYNCDDIWVRDFFPKLFTSANNKVMINYQFNAYGKKYNHFNDNKFKEIFDFKVTDFDFEGIALEGGNLEFSSRGVAITNINSIKENNFMISAEDIERKFKELRDMINIPELYIINVTNILGDDTNGHIDNLVRFINDDTIVYFASKDRNYCNYQVARNLEKEINIIAKKSKIINNIIPIFHDEKDTFIKNNKIYPYSKLNFILTKGVFIFPCLSSNYDQINNDIQSLSLESMTYSLDTEAALLENGGLHCLTANI